MSPVDGGRFDKYLAPNTTKPPAATVYRSGERRPRPLPRRCVGCGEFRRAIAPSVTCFGLASYLCTPVWFVTRSAPGAGRSVGCWRGGAQCGAQWGGAVDAYPGDAAATAVEGGVMTAVENDDDVIAAGDGGL
eukprot:CAMPEP_0113713550 /NCGR_PEP_ID=MMETSP0038_2-20120614/32066_1 /TAXON_ID=2898 /ORGANISM="Cryptomonas paramecium" /LENGTH=132 /DNA_ID=CAMNT_0000640313 /DNA_START=643 /DNA_END=1041 /DNA_ORIENTATION=+ /assembly_acc=CAM_ASM_000170